MARKSKGKILRELAEQRIRAIIPLLELASMSFKLGTKQHRSILTAALALNKGDFNMVRKSKSKIHKVMGEYKRGKLHSGSKRGPKVKSRRQALAIALSESRRGKK